MKTPSVALLLLGFAISTADAQVSQEWVARYASPTTFSDIPYAMTVDAAENIYVTGATATAGSDNWATIKYNSAGEQEWLRTLDGGGNDAAVAITTDEAGNVYVTGSFEEIVDFDPGPGSRHLTSEDEDDIFIAKYNTDGALLWAHSFVGGSDGDGSCRGRPASRRRFRPAH